MASLPSDLFTDVICLMQPRVMNAIRDLVKQPYQKAGWGVEVDVLKKKDYYEVQADLPGMAKNDIGIEITEDGVLRISGERKCVENNGYISTRRYGKFMQEVYLPEDAILDKISAKMDNGVLCVQIQRTKPEPITEKTKNVRKVHIE